MQKLIARTYRTAFTAGILAIMGASVAHEAAAAPADFQGLRVEVVGTGRPVLMIPGLNSGPDTWRDTCAALQAGKVQCHLVHLPGFAGLPAAGEGPFLETMRDRLLAYAEAKRLRRPAVVGHSLGGVLALQMAIKAPEAVGPLVIVDSLPFMSAIQNPAATAESVRPMAEAMRRQMDAADDATYRQQAQAAMQGMTRDPARSGQIREWGLQSDRRVTAQAMFDMMTTDLRPQLSAVKSPTLVLGAWAAYKPFGSTKESTAGIFRAQFAQLDGMRLEMSEDGYHFLMWDDPKWLQSHVAGFLAANPPAQ